MRQKRAEFFLPGGKNFLNGDKPDQATFQDFADSMCFPKELTDRAKLSEAGLSKITTDLRINQRSDLDQLGISPLGFPTFIRPSQLPNIVAGDVDVIITQIARNGSSPGFTYAPDILDWEISIDHTHPFIPEDTDDLDWAVQFTGPAEAYVRSPTAWSPGSGGGGGGSCGMTLENTPLPLGTNLSLALAIWLEKGNATASTLGVLGNEICGIFDRINLLESFTATGTYTFLASDMLNGCKLSNNTDNPDGNEHKPHMRIINNTVTFHGVILVPNTITDDTDVMKIPRDFLNSLLPANGPVHHDRSYIVEHGGLPTRVSVKMGNIGGGPSPTDWGALNFTDCKVEAASGVNYEEVLNNYRRLSLNGITFNITEI